MWEYLFIYIHVCVCAHTGIFNVLTGDASAIGAELCTNPWVKKVGWACIVASGVGFSE
jgi:acyl-CoA reductase-like NAD-dependent aldehyde dehydrogenase